MSKPEMSAVPLVAVMSPVSMLNVVVFPAPGNEPVTETHELSTTQQLSMNEKH